MTYAPPLLLLLTVASMTDGELDGESERTSEAILGWPGQRYEAG
jgi:hypothetical protein